MPQTCLHLPCRRRSKPFRARAGCIFIEEIFFEGVGQRMRPPSWKAKRRMPREVCPSAFSEASCIDQRTCVCKQSHHHIMISAFCKLQI